MKTGIEFEYTNSCTCTVYNEDSDSDDFIPSDFCFGDCWEYVIDDFTMLTKKLFENNETNWWRVSKLKLWNGETGGFFFADNVKKLIQGMSVNGEWIMRGEVFNDCIEYSLSHHDAPMGSSTTLTIITEEQREEFGLY